MNKKIIILLVMLLCFPFIVFADGEDVAQQFQGFNLQGYTDGGEKAWDVTGDTADVLGDEVKISNVDANHYGEQNVNLKARTGTINKTTGDVILEKDVVITTEEGSQLTTDSLTWEKEKDFVHTEDYVEITDERLKASGTGLEAQPGLKTARMNKDVKMEINTKPSTVENRVLVITCDGQMEIDQPNNVATFNDNVVAIETDRMLKADKMTVYFDPDQKKIRQVICSGNVEIKQGENTSYSTKAIYNAFDQTMVLSGRPKLIMVMDEVSGEANPFK